MARKSTLLMIDSIINLALGALLLFFPASIVEFLGVPKTDNAFYPSILGAVLLGIGIALLIEYYGERRDLRGLGLEGAVVINLIGGTVLGVWLVAGGLSIPTKGYVFLWLLVVLLIGISGLELIARRRQPEDSSAR